MLNHLIILHIGIWVQMTFNKPMCLLCISDYYPFWGLLPKKHVFIKRSFEIKYNETFYLLCLSCPNVSYVFLQLILNIYEFSKMYRFCQILCFILKNCHNFKSYQNMLAFSNLISYIINYNFFKNNIYIIASHLHIIKDLWTFKNP